MKRRRPATNCRGPHYLFRSDQENIFLSSDDPAFRYNTLCGHCGFPVEQKEPRCPRCQRELEDCPVCRETSNQRALRKQVQGDGSLRCSVCGSLRFQVGEHLLAEVEGSFCSNVYGCPAGGLLTRTDNVVYWPTGQSVCGVCRSSELPLRPVSSFSHLVRRCLFCSAVFGLSPSPRWRLVDGPSWPLRSQDAAGDESPCLLCGRNDERYSDDTVRSNSVDPWDTEAVEDSQLDLATYFRIIELGWALIISPESNRVATHYLLGRWFDRQSPDRKPPEKTSGLMVSQVVGHLIEGTLRPGVRKILQDRLKKFIQRWEQLEVDMSHKLPVLHLDSADQ